MTPSQMSDEQFKEALEGNGFLPELALEMINRQYGYEPESDE